MRWKSAGAALAAAAILVLSACEDRVPQTGAQGAASPGPTTAGEATPNAVGSVASSNAPAPSAEVHSTPAAAGPATREVPPPAIHAQAALVFDAGSGAALYESNAHERLAPASLTKIATAVVVLEQGLPLDRVIEVNPDLDKEWLDDI